MKNQKMSTIILIAMMTIICAAMTTNASDTLPVDNISQFTVSVPTVLPVEIDASNNAIVIKDAYIVNNNDRPMTITDISIKEKNGWSLVQEPSSQTGKREISFSVNTDITHVPVGEKASIVYRAKISPQIKQISGEAALDVIFTVGWDDLDEIPPDIPETPEPEAPEKGDIYSEGIYEYSYGHANGLNGVNGLWGPVEGQQGWGVRIKDNDIPLGAMPAPLAEIKGKPVTNYSYLFAYSSTPSLDLRDFNVAAVTDMSNMFYSAQATHISVRSFDTSNVTTFSNMFAYTSALSIDLSNLNTSNVIDMNNMFYGSRAESINVDGFDTRNVVNASNMFAYTEIAVLDLSSFDVLNISDMRTMCWLTKIKEGFGKTQADCDRLNATTGNPASGIFIPKL